MQPGRSCPLHYRTSPARLAGEADLAADTLYIAGGLYGNLPALEALLDMAARERGSATLIFNGDFNWFDVDAETYSAINHEVLRHVALRGNVETEIAGDDPAAGCGCAYPESVTDAEVQRSNEITEQLRATARRFPLLRAHLARLPMQLTAMVGGMRVGIVHGDAHSLAGWRYAEEALRGEEAQAALADDFTQSGCRVIASSHTCLPVAVDCATAHGRCVLINNGAAGMPNFTDTRHGVITRVALAAATHVAPLYATRLERVVIEALPLRYDHDRWVRSFLRDWPAGTPAHRSYFRRISHGPPYRLGDAARWRIDARDSHENMQDLTARVGP
ncbi:MAG: metallophosphoesterase family protein [Betaproteobacteria bacterium]